MDNKTSVVTEKRGGAIEIAQIRQKDTQLNMLNNEGCNRFILLVQHEDAFELLF